MGLNYYAVPSATDELKKTLCEKIMADDFEGVEAWLPRKIHIGKSSIGWKFLFNHHHWKHFNNDYFSLEAFLSNNRIIDEYGRHVSFDDFWKMVDKKLDMKPELEHGKEYFGLNFSNYTEFS